MIHYTAQNAPLAANGLQSYRYQGRHGYIMIGARDTQDALRQAHRSVSDGRVSVDNLEVWNGQINNYVKVNP